MQRARVVIGLMCMVSVACHGSRKPAAVPAVPAAPAPAASPAPPGPASAGSGCSAPNARKLASDDGIGAIVAGKDTVYWDGDGGGKVQLQATPEAGGATRTLFEIKFGSDVPEDLVGDGEGALYYHASGGRIFEVPTSGGAPKPVLANKDFFVGKLLVDGADLWFAFGRPLGAFGIARVGSSGGKPKLIVDGLTAEQAAYALDLVGSSIYWVTLDGTLFRAPRSGGAAAQVDAGPGTDDAARLTHDGSFIYVSRNLKAGGAELVRIPLAGGAAEVVEREPSKIEALAIRGDELLVGLESGAVRGIAKGTKQQRDLACAPATVHAIAAVDGRVYFAASDFGNDGPGRGTLWAVDH